MKIKYITLKLISFGTLHYCSIKSKTVLKIWFIFDKA